MHDDVLTSLLQGGFRYALALTRQRNAAEDLLQDAWVAVLQARGPCHRGYLFAPIRSQFLNRHRRESLISVVPLDELEGELVDETTVGDEDTLALLDAAQLDNALALLRPLEREALFLAVVEEYTAQEIAELTGQPRGTVLSLVHRARQKLRRALTLPSNAVKRLS